MSFTTFIVFKKLTCAEKSPNYYSQNVSKDAIHFINFSPTKINLYVGLFLLLIGLKNNIISIDRFIRFFLRYESIYLILMGIVHGLTNLGGALLSGAVFNKKLSKDSKRATIAICYLSMGLMRIIPLIL